VQTYIPSPETIVFNTNLTFLLSLDSREAQHRKIHIHALHEVLSKRSRFIDVNVVCHVLPDSAEVLGIKMLHKVALYLILWGVKEVGEFLDLCSDVDLHILDCPGLPCSVIFADLSTGWLVHWRGVIGRRTIHLSNDPRPEQFAMVQKFIESTQFLDLLLGLRSQLNSRNVSLKLITLF